MIKSLVVMPAFFKKDYLGLLVEDSSSLIKIAEYNFDLALEVDETIYLKNFSFKRNYTFEARVRSKLKILKAEVMASPNDAVMATPNDDMYTLIMEYIVEIVKEEDLVMIRKIGR